MMKWIEEANEEVTSESEILSFFDYFENVFSAHPEKQVRPSYEYLKDMFEYFGRDEKGNFGIFEQNAPLAGAVFGQKRAQKNLFQNLVNFEEEGYNNRFILLVGPNGSSKSSIVRRVIHGAEEYSKTDEGALYTFSWVFPIDNVTKGSLGLTGSMTTSDVRSFAYLEDKDINAIITSDLKDHPLLLVPKEHRQKIIEEALVDHPELLETIRKSYFYIGDLSKRNRMIYDALLKSHKGKHSEVLKYIRVERFNISKRYSTSAVTIEPQLHVDARMQQITMDRRLASLPPSLQSINLFNMTGEVVMANRGVLEFSDLLKRPLDSFKYLLQTMETGNINLGGIQTALDILFLGTSNEVHLAAFKQHPDFNSFKGRFVFIRVPYLLDYKDEEKIYEELVEGLVEKVNFEPYSLRAICLFSVLTRLRTPMSKNYNDKKLTDIVTSLNPLEKALFISENEVPDRLDTESAQTLRQNRELILEEFESENLYEGKFGISPRSVKSLIYNLSSLHKTVTFVEVLELLEKIISRKNEYDFLNMTPQGDYHNPPRYLSLIKKFCLDNFDRELRNSLGMVDDRSYEEYLRKYIENVNAMIKGEKIKNEITGKYEPVEMHFIGEFESSINLKEDADKFRSHLISKLGAWYLDNSGKKIVYGEVFPELVDRLQESFRNEQKKVIQDLSRSIVFYEAEMKRENDRQSPLTEEARKQIRTLIDNLVSKHGYSHDGAMTLLKETIKDRY